MIFLWVLFTNCSLKLIKSLMEAYFENLSKSLRPSTLCSNTDVNVPSNHYTDTNYLSWKGT